MCRWLVMAGAVVAAGVAGCGGGSSSTGPLKEDPAVITGCQAELPPAGQTRAKRVECAQEVPRGRHASARNGDIVIDSSRARFVIRQLGEGYFLLGSAGGQLIDAAPAGGEDQLKELVPLFALNVGDYKELAIVDAGGAGPAEVVVRGPLMRLPVLTAAVGGSPVDGTVEMHYIVEPDATRIAIRTLIRSPTPAGQVADILFVGGAEHSFLPGAGGFDHGNTAGADYVATDGTSVSYGMVYATEVLPGLRVLDTGGILGVLGADAKPGQPLERFLLVGDGSVASITTQALAVRGEARGEITGMAGPGEPVTVEDATKRAVTHARAGVDGSFRVSLPPGAYTLRIDNPQRAAGETRTATVTAGGTASVTLPVPPQGTLTLHARDAAAAGVPARVTLTGTAPRTLVIPASGDLTVGLPPGPYHVAVSRGMEYSLAEADVSIVAGATVEQTLTLTRLLDTAGWVAADFHLHSEMSTDSTMTLPDRLLACASEGLDYVVSTDHDFIAVYQPVIEDLGLPLSAASGEELSSVVWGHINGWPLTPQPDKSGLGAVRWDGKSPGEVFDALRGGDADRVVQVNHPRFGSTSLFDAIDFDPLTVRARRDPVALGLPAGSDLSDFDFDAIEVSNGIGDEDFEQVLADWLALVRSGHRAAATGTSDSHGPTAFAGSPRTYVYVGAGNDTGGRVDDRLVARGIHERRVMASGGAFIDVHVGSAAIGQLATDTDGEIEVAIRVQAPPYLALTRLRLLVGAQTITVPLDPQKRAVVRYDSSLRVPVSADTYVVVIADPAGNAEPVIKKDIPSLANPILIDANGDGMYSPPR